MRGTQRLVGIAIIAAWGLMLAPAAHAMPAPSDDGPSDPAVTDNTGAARFRIPIEDPPGPGGFAPHIELTYSSRSGDGPFGVGWTLGIPEIRCSDRFGVPNYASCEKYELDGVLLVKDPANPHAYHTDVESFQRIRYVPANNSWTVEQANGTKLIFGEDAGHRIAQGGATARWLLERMEDAFTNKVFLEYDTAADVGSAYLKSVFYGAGATSTLGPREVRFKYQTRSDPRNVYSGGIERKITQRLNEIQVFGHSQIFRRYAFGYTLESVTYTTDRSRLSWVKEFGTDCANPAADPVATCNGLPRHELRYLNVPGSYESNDGLRIPFGSYPNGSYSNRLTFPQLIGDINGDGLPDRLELRPNPSSTLAPATALVLINTGTGFAADDAKAVLYKASFDSLKYFQPGLEYKQIPSPGVPESVWGSTTWPLGSATGTMYGMCWVAPRLPREATLSQELSIRGVRAATSSLAALRASGDAPSDGFFEPRPTVKLVDIDADGLADLVVSVRLSGVDRNFDCNNPGTPLANPEHIPDQSVAVVFRNTGSGWVNDAAAQALARGLPPFEEVIVKSTYQTEVDEPSTTIFQQGYMAASPCANYSYLGFEQGTHVSDANKTAVCHVPIDLAPQFIDFNGDGLLDLAVLQRRDPNLLWTGETPVPPGTGERNDASTRVWIQTPNASDRWTRAPQYDLPSNIFVNESNGSPWYTNFAHVKLFHALYLYFPGIHCVSWDDNFSQCGPDTYTTDSGVRLADINGDGLADVVWNWGSGTHQGVLLNKGGGSASFSAWCASSSDIAQRFSGSTCSEAAAYVPPESFVFFADLAGNSTVLPDTTGWLADLNGDGLPDFVRFRYNTFNESWIQTPTPTGTPATRWKRATSFDLPINLGRSLVYAPTIYSPFLGFGVNQYLPGMQIFDVNGDGSADLVTDQQALLSQTTYGDLIESVKNGHGGEINVEYASAITQRNSALEDAVVPDAQHPEGGDAGVWRPTPVVSRIRLQGSGFATATTDYRYAHPRYSSEFRSDLGFRLVEKTRADGSKVEEYFYQDHGRAGHTSKRLVKDAGQVVHQYEEIWNLVTTTIPGSIAGVFVGRLASETSAFGYPGGATGAAFARTFTYDDGYGYNFVSQISTARPTGTLLDTRVPVPVPATGPYLVGRIAQRTLTDGPTVLRDTIYTYFDLGNVPTGPKLGSRRELISERGATGGHSVDVVKLRYDAHGNPVEERTPSPTGGDRSTLFCYDGDTSTSWCTSPSGQTSRSVVVTIKDPAGKVTRFTPDARSGIVVETTSDYTDEPATSVTLDAFARPTFIYATPTGGSGGPVLVAKNVYDDAHGPLRVERFDYVDEAASESIYSAEILGSFGGNWKTIAATPSGYVATVRFSNPTMRRARTTVALSCGSDATCAAYSGETQAAAQEVTTDAVGRPVRIDTPDGFSIRAYRSVANRWGGSGQLDAVLEKNGKGDLVDRALDGDRTVWVDECHVGVAASVSSLAGVTCGLIVDTTRYTYEATGEIRRISDPQAVATSNFADVNHRLLYHYDTLGRVVRIEDPDLDGTGVSLITYSDAGNVETTTNARGQGRTFTYDALDRLVGISTPSSEDSYTVEYRSGEWQRAKDYSHAYERVRTYDGWGRVKQTKLSVLEDTGPAYGQTWSGTYFMDFKFDLAGRPVEVTYPESTVVRYEYQGAYLKRVCDRGSAVNCSGSSVVKYVSDVSYDALGRRTSTATAAGTRAFTYDGSLSRLHTDRFDSSSPGSYWFQLNYDDYDEVGNLTTLTGSSKPGDIDLNQSFQYDRRNRLATWTQQGTPHSYGYDQLGNLNVNDGSAQSFNDSARPHALKGRANGNATYAQDADGNVTSILATGSNRFFQFDSANRMVCADSVQGGCGLNHVHYDVDGRRVLDDSPTSLQFAAFVDDDVNLDGGLAPETRIEIRAFDERIAYKRSGDAFRTAGLAAPWGLPPVALELLAGLSFVGLLAWLAKRGALVLVIERPAYAGISAVLIVILVLGPLPGVRASRAGGGGGASFYWELADRLGTGLVMVDETGARRVHRTYSPFGVETASVGSAEWLPRHFAGHLEDEASGLVYMQARWMDPQSGTFLSVDPVVGDAADPQAFNAYAYARNNPGNFTDPTGQFYWDTAPSYSPGFAFGGYTGPPGGEFGDTPEGILIMDATGDGLGFGVGLTVPAPSGTVALGGLGSLGIGDLGGPSLGGGLNGGGGSGAASQSGSGLGNAALVGVSIAAGFIPGLGEALDVAVLGNPSSTAMDLTLAGVSLAANFFIPVLPNFGAVARAARSADTFVYLGIRQGRPVYTGITRDLARRAAEHGDRFLLRAITPQAVTRSEARAIEQALIVRNPGFENRINSISPLRAGYDTAVEWGESWLRANGL